MNENIRTIQTPNAMEHQIVEFLVSRINLFKRADCELMAEFIAIQTNMSVEKVSEIIDNFLATQNKVIIKNATYFLTV